VAPLTVPETSNWSVLPGALLSRLVILSVEETPVSLAARRSTPVGEVDAVAKLTLATKASRLPPWYELLAPGEVR